MGRRIDLLSDPLISEEPNSLHELLEMVMVDVTPEQLAWQPPGIANPVGAFYDHAVAGDDGVVNALLR